MAKSAQDLRITHSAIFALQAEMLADSQLRALCDRYGLPWDPARGYEPRWYNGPQPDHVKLLVLLAEPGAITPTEAHQLLPAVQHSPWLDDFDLTLQEHYWRANLRELCKSVWPQDTDSNMNAYLGGSCTFWMSLPPGKQTRQVPRELLDYFGRTYLRRLLGLFPHAVIVAAGAKASERLRDMGVPFESCSAFTRPESNKPRARASWRQVGEVVARRIEAVKSS